MTTDERTLIDIGKMTVHGTDKNSSRPDEVLFFATAHILFLNFVATAKVAHFVLPQTHKPAQKSKQKEPLFPTLY
jgi:hypothetical protein